MLGGSDKDPAGGKIPCNHSESNIKLLSLLKCFILQCVASGNYINSVDVSRHLCSYSQLNSILKIK